MSHNSNLFSISLEGSSYRESTVFTFYSLYYVVIAICARQVLGTLRAYYHFAIDRGLNRLLQYRLPGKLHFNIFHWKASIVIFSE